MATQRAEEHVRYGFNLAQRGAYFTAHQEFVQALRVIAKAWDVETGTNERRAALETGLRALEEVAAPAWRQPGQAAALQRHLYEARRQLAWSVRGEPAASQALYALARLEVVIAEESPERDSLSGPKAMALHQAALAVDPANYLAANELAVLFVRYGQLEEAEQVLTHGLSAAAVAEIWHNLAVVYQRMGRTEAAKQARARHEALLAARRNGGAPAEAAPPGDVASMIRWTDPAEFERRSPRGSDGVQLAKNDPAGAAPRAEANRPVQKSASVPLLPQWLSRGLKNVNEK